MVGEIGDGLTGRDPFERYSIVLLLRLLDLFLSKRVGFQ